MRCVVLVGRRGPVEHGRRGVEADGALPASPAVIVGMSAAASLPLGVPGRAGPAIEGLFGRDHVEMIDITELYRYLLGIEAPWEVTGIELSEHQGRVDVSVGHPSRTRFPCPAARGFPARSAGPNSRCMTIPRIEPGVISIVAGA